MILTDYYKFERVATISKHRMDCTVSTGGYTAFEQLRKVKAQRATEKRDAINVGDLIVYWGLPIIQTKTDRKRKADRSITSGDGNISSVYNFQYREDLWYAYGDVKGTTDALLFIYKIEEPSATIQAGSFIEVFIARGKSNECNALCNLLLDGELEEEMNALRKLAESARTVENSTLSLY